MALLAVVRRLHLHKQTPFLRFSQHSRSSSHQFISPPPRFCAIIFSQAFHRTPCGQGKHTLHFGVRPHAHARIPYRITEFSEYADETDEGIKLGLGEILERVGKAKDLTSGDEAISFLDDSNVKPDKDLIFSVVWALREDWKLAFLVFKWGEKWDCIVEKTWCLMIWLLGNHNKFSTAWTLIQELYRNSKDTQQAMLIMIDRYAVANYPDKAIHTFHLMQKFKFSPEQNTYFTFLNILCKHGNMEEAEEFMFLNKKFYPLETESFNIILDGWCNIAKDIYQAKRIWREMSKSCIWPNGTSYTHMISCFSSIGNLFDSLRLYDEMKRRGWIPGVDVYHSLIYVMTRENCLSQALKIVDRMKETGLEPNSATYNLIINPLCEALKFEEARNVLAKMMKDEISPTIDTYHALLKGESIEGALGVLDYMRKAGLGPNKDTFLLILDRFLKLGQPDNALKIWSEMNEYSVEPDGSHYRALVQGLVKCGLTEKGREFYSEMRCVLLVYDLVLEKLLEEQGRARKGNGEITVVRNIKKGKGLRCGRNRVLRSRKRKSPAVRK